MNVGSLFTGIRGLDLGLEHAGFRTVWTCESDSACRRVIERTAPGIPIIPDVRDIDAGLERPDVLVGGFPCPDFSVAGKRLMFKGERAQLWFEFARAIRLLRPRHVVVENVPGLLAALGVVLGDLAEAGYVGQWFCLRAADVGAPHRRERVFVVASLADGKHESQEREGDALIVRGRGERTPERRGEQFAAGTRASSREVATDAERERVRAGHRDASRPSGTGEGETQERQWVWTDDRERGRAAADAVGERRDRGGGRDEGPSAGGGADGRAVSQGHSAPAPDADRIGLEEPARRGTAAAPGDRNAAAVPDGSGSQGAQSAGRRDVSAGSGRAVVADADGVEWGAYGPAVRRWELILGRPAPRPTDTRGRLEPRFVEWMMGFPDHWTDGEKRTARLRILGNAVQVQVAEAVGAILREETAA